VVNIFTTTLFATQAKTKRSPTLLLMSSQRDGRGDGDGSDDAEHNEDIDVGKHDDAVCNRPQPKPKPKPCHLLMWYVVHVVQYLWQLATQYADCNGLDYHITNIVCFDTPSANFHMLKGLKHFLCMYVDDDTNKLRFHAGANPEKLILEQKHAIRALTQERDDLREQLQKFQTPLEGSRPAVTMPSTADARNEGVTTETPSNALCRKTPNCNRRDKHPGKCNQNLDAGSAAAPIAASLMHLITSSNVGAASGVAASGVAASGVAASGVAASGVAASGVAASVDARADVIDSSALEHDGPTPTLCAKNLDCSRGYRHPGKCNHSLAGVFPMFYGSVQSPTVKKEAGEEIVKKKRGRPKKQVVEDSGEEKEAGEKIVKKKRGRPKKQVVEEEAEGEEADGEEAEGEEADGEEADGEEADDEEDDY
jgi:hypothetical protein